MTFTIGAVLVKLIITAVLSAGIAFFVGAAWGKRVTLRGGTVSGEIAKARKAANERLQAEIKEIKERAKDSL